VAAPVRVPRLFLLSPANAGGERGRLLLREQAEFDLAVRLRQGHAPLGDVYSFISGLYFRGKMAYSAAFQAPPEGVPGALVITPGFGLVPANVSLSIEQLKTIASVPVDDRNPDFRNPLQRDARLIWQHTGSECLFVLLGSIATGKYVTPLLEVFGERLVFPSDFVGRGDMSRGGLMLRAARSGIELAYAPVGSVSRHGPRPPRLPKIPRHHA
jgi:hypothetical protein